MSTNAELPANPVPGLNHDSDFNGLAKREHFAAMAPPAPSDFPWRHSLLAPVHPYQNPRRRPELPGDPVVKGRLQQWLADDGGVDPAAFCDDLPTEQQRIAEQWEAQFLSAVEQFEADDKAYRESAVARRQATWAVQYADALLAELERTS